MVKFGAYLSQNVDPTISASQYLNYNELKGVIKKLTEKKLGVSGFVVALIVCLLSLCSLFALSCSLFACPTAICMGACAVYVGVK